MLNQSEKGTARGIFGFIYHWYYQATDLTLLIIAALSLIMLMKNSHAGHDSFLAKVDRNKHLILTFIWVFPLLTTTTVFFDLGFPSIHIWYWIHNTQKPIGPFVPYSLNHALIIVCSFVVHLQFVIQND